MSLENPRFSGRKHTAESNLKRSETIKNMYKNGITTFGFKTKYTTEEQRTEARKINRLMTRYGITKEEFNSMLENQNGICLICPKPAVVVDHDHKTNIVRGLLCAQCNTGIGFFEDNPELLMQAAMYLKMSKNYEE